MRRASSVDEIEAMRPDWALKNRRASVRPGSTGEEPSKGGSSLLVVLSSYFKHPPTWTTLENKVFSRPFTASCWKSLLVLVQPSASWVG